MPNDDRLLRWALRKPAKTKAEKIVALRERIAKLSAQLAALTAQQERPK